MNYGGDAADQIVRYSMEGMEHTLRISGSIAKNLAVLSIRFIPPYSEERKAAASAYAKEHGFQVVGAEEKIA